MLAEVVEGHDELRQARRVGHLRVDLGLRHGRLVAGLLTLRRLGERRSPLPLVVVAELLLRGRDLVAARIPLLVVLLELHLELGQRFLPPLLLLHLLELELHLLQLGRLREVLIQDRELRVEAAGTSTP